MSENKFGEPWYTTGCPPGSTYTSIMSWPAKCPVDERRIEKANRIVACVNALSGVAEPGAAIKAAREAMNHAERSMAEMAETHVMETPSSCKEIADLLHTALTMLGGSR